MVKSCETLASELSPVHHLQQDLKFWQKKSLCVSDLSTTAWGSTIFETVTYFEVVVAQTKAWRLTLLRGMRGREGQGRREPSGRQGASFFNICSCISVYTQYIYFIFVYQYIFCLVHIPLVQVGPAGSRVGWSAVLQARALLCKPGDSVT